MYFHHIILPYLVLFWFRGRKHNFSLHLCCFSCVLFFVLFFVLVLVFVMSARTKVIQESVRTIAGAGKRSVLSRGPKRAAMSLVTSLLFSLSSFSFPFS